MSRHKHSAAFPVMLVVMAGLSVLFAGRDTARAVDSGDNLLVWLGNGAAPGSHTTANPGQLALMDADGNVVRTLMDVPPFATRVIPCGSAATSPDGEHFAFFVGTDSGSLYLMSGAAAPALVNDGIPASTCVGGDMLAYSRDGSQIMYLVYDPAISTDEFSAGSLHIASTRSGEDLKSFIGVVTFHANNQLVGLVRFFPNSRGEADEAGVFLWNGETETEVATLYPTQDCRFTSARVGIRSQNRLVLLMAHRCPTGEQRTTWQFYTVDASARSATLQMSGVPAGGFLPFARTNNLIFSPDRSTVYFTVPDGVIANTVSITAVDLAAITPDHVVIGRNAVMPRVENKPYDLARNAFPALSPDGRWLALVTNTPDNQAALNVLDLSSPSAVPISVPAQRPGETISSLAFSLDSSRLVFVSGGHSGAENGLYGIDLAAGDDFSIKNGRYGYGAVSSDGASVALMEWQSAGDAQYLTLVLVDIASGNSTLLFMGATFSGDDIAEQRFAYPLAWRHN